MLRPSEAAGVEEPSLLSPFGDSETRFRRGLLVHALLAALPDWPHNKYRLKCLVKNSRARAFYCSKGFVVTGSGTSPEGDFEEMSFYPDA